MKNQMTVMKSDDSKSRSLNYKASPFSALMITVLSLFMQWFIWYVYEKAGYSFGYNYITPLILCLMYHFVQLDSGKNGNFSRLFFFVFAVTVPLVLSIGLSAVMYLNYPDISPFDPDAGYTGSAKEVIATYAGRITITSVYLLIFSAIDVPILKASEHKRKNIE
ncbi:MAG: hypothetical protein IKS13_05350 [Ruminococcus sp.]|nr:hypothetical protein [Ruminococcus sp.]MCR5729713.1 hypothetical protein [Ruminococcus sp.]